MSANAFAPRHTRSVLWLEVALLVLASGLGALLWWEWQQGVEFERTLARWKKLPATPVPPLAVLPEFSLPDATSGFPELLARPIFQPSRRPSIELRQVGPSAMKRGQFVLVGVVISPTQSVALLRDKDSGATQAVVVGAQIRGLTLAEVFADRAILRLGAETEEIPLTLQRGAGGQPAAPASGSSSVSAVSGSGAAAPAPASASAPAPAPQPVIEGTIPPTFPVPPTPPNPYQNSKPLGALGVGPAAGGAGAGRPTGSGRAR
jgi:hypothetical protein